MLLWLTAQALAISQAAERDRQRPHWPLGKTWTPFFEDGRCHALLCPESPAALSPSLPFWHPLPHWSLSSFLLFSPPPSSSPSFQKKVVSFFFLTLFFRAFSLAAWCHSPSPPVNRTVLIKMTYKRSPGAMCAEPASQRDGPSWTTFELKRMFLFTSTSFQLNKGKLKGSHLNPRSIKLYIFRSW